MTDTTSNVRQMPGHVLELPITSVHPAEDNPRDELTGIDELAASIEERGLLVPILVVPHPTLGIGEYLIVAGHRRFAAHQQLGAVFIRAIIGTGDTNTARVQRLVENLQRVDLTPLEEAHGYRQVLDEDPDLTQDALARLVGRSPGHISKRLALCELPAPAVEALRAGGLNVTTAYELADLARDEPAEALRIAETMHTECADTTPGVDRPAADNVVTDLLDTLRTIRERRARFDTQVAQAGTLGLKELKRIDHGRYVTAPAQRATHVHVDDEHLRVTYLKARPAPTKAEVTNASKKAAEARQARAERAQAIRTRLVEACTAIIAGRKLYTDYVLDELIAGRCPEYVDEIPAAELAGQETLDDLRAWAAESANNRSKAACCVLFADRIHTIAGDFNYQDTPRVDDWDREAVAPFYAVLTDAGFDPTPEERAYLAGPDE